MRKRIISLLLSLVMIISMMPMFTTTASAATMPNPDHNSSNDTSCAMLLRANNAMRWSSTDYYVAMYNIHGVYNHNSLYKSFRDGIPRAFEEALNGDPGVTALSDLCLAFGNGIEFSEQDLYDYMLSRMLLGNAYDLSEEIVDTDTIEDFSSFLQLTIDFEGEVYTYYELLKTVFGDSTKALRVSSLIGLKLEGVADHFPFVNKLLDFAGGELDSYFFALSAICKFADEFEEAAKGGANLAYAYYYLGNEAKTTLESMYNNTDDKYLKNSISKYYATLSSDDIWGLLQARYMEAENFKSEFTVALANIALRANLCLMAPVWAAAEGTFAAFDLWIHISEENSCIKEIQLFSVIDEAILDAIADLEYECLDDWEKEASIDYCEAYIFAMQMAWRLQTEELKKIKEYLDKGKQYGWFDDYFDNSTNVEQWNNTIEYATNAVSTFKPKSFINNALDQYSRDRDLIIAGYKITYDSNGGTEIPSGTKKYNEPYSLTNTVPTKDGYTFTVWQLGDNTYYSTGYELEASLNPCWCSRELVLTAQWTDQATITYNANGGETAPPSHENTEGDTNLSYTWPTWYGHTFLAWATEPDPDENAKLYAPGELFPTDGDVTLYAIWAPATFNIIFDANGGQFDEDDTTQISKPKQYGQAFDIDITAPYGNDGYVFACEWIYKYEDGTTETYQHGAQDIYDIGDDTTNDKVLYAVWNDAEAEVSYDYGDDPTGENTTTSVEKVDLSAGEATYTIKNAEALNTYNGNSFKGWIYQDPNGPYWWANVWADNGPYTLYQPGTQIPLSGDLTLYAKWTYFVHYDHGGEQYTHAEVGDGVAYTVAEPAYTNGEKVFQGWQYVNDNGETITCQPGDQINLFSDLYLTAVWEESSYIAGGVYENATWVITEDNELIIRGTGGISDEAWIKYRNQVFTIDVGSGITQVQLNNSGVRIDGTYYSPYSRIDTLSLSDTVSDLTIVGIPGLSGLKQVVVDENNPYYTAKDGVLFSKDMQTLFLYPVDKTGVNVYEIPEGVTHIASDAFAATCLVAVEIPASVQSIGCAFPFCSSLTGLYFYGDLPALPAYLFELNQSHTTLYYVEGKAGWTTPAQSTGTTEYPTAAFDPAATDPSEIVIDSGTCGDNISWTLTINGKLDISGTGEMYDYSESTAPWDVYSASDKDIIRTISISDGITTIGAGAFSPQFLNGGEIRIDHLSKDLIEIGDKAFNCSSLVGDITLPENLERIGQRAFAWSNITSVWIPASCDLIGKADASSYYTYNPFAGCEDLVSIEVDAANTAYHSVDGVLYNKDITELIAYPLNKADTCLSIPATVTHVSAGAVGSYSTSNLKTIEIPAGLNNVDAIVHAVLALESYVVDDENTMFCSVDGVLYSKDMTRLVAYPNGKRDSSYVMPNSVATANGAFEFINTSPSYLTHLTISAAMTELDGLRCLPVLQSVAVDDGSATYTDLDGVLFSKDMKTIVWYPTQKAGSTYIVPASVEVIGNSAFSICSALKYLFLIGAVKELETSAIVSCHSLVAICLGENVTSVAPHALSHINRINIFFMGDAPEFFGANTVYDTHVLRFIEEKAGWTSPFWTGSDGTTYLAKPFDPDAPEIDNCEDEVVGTCGENLWYHIADDVLTIGGAGTMKAYGQGGFPWNAYTDQFSSVVIAPGVTSIAEFAFADLSNFSTIRIPDTVTSIGSWAFWYCTGLEAVDIPPSVATIGTSAFSFCMELSNLHVDEANGSYTSADGVLFNADMTALIQFPRRSALKTYAIPDTVSEICQCAFANTNLSEVLIPDSVTSIGPWAFWNCEANFTKVIIPASVSYIADSAFQYSGYLEDVYFMGNVPATFGAAAVADCSSELVLHYISGKSDWTSPIWTAADGTVYKTEVFVPGTVLDVEVENNKTVTCAINSYASNFTQMIVGAYEIGTGKFFGAAMGQYDGRENTITVTFVTELPEAYELKAFCTDENFVPKYKASCFSLGT